MVVKDCCLEGTIYYELFKRSFAIERTTCRKNDPSSLS